jgi:quercetin dioxygenase-like cupin family protein
MFVRSATSIPREGVPVGAGITKQVLIGPDQGPNFALRKFSMQPGGGMPLHTNTVEHEQYVLRGRARVMIGDEVLEVKKDDVVFIPQGNSPFLSHPGGGALRVPLRGAEPSRTRPLSWEPGTRMKDCPWRTFRPLGQGIRGRAPGSGVRVPPSPEAPGGPGTPCLRDPQAPAPTSRSSTPVRHPMLPAAFPISSTSTVRQRIPSPS